MTWEFVLPIHFACAGSQPLKGEGSSYVELSRVLSLPIFVESVSTVVRVFEYMYAEIPPHLKDYTFQKYV